MTADIRTIDLSTIKELLAMRDTSVGEDDCEEAVTLAAQGVANPDEMRAADEHLKCCALCREALLVLAALDARSAQGRASSPRQRLGRRGAVWRSPFALAAAAVIVAGLAAVFWLSRGRDALPRPGRGLAVKGATDGFQIAVQRGSARFAVRRMDTLLEGDRLGLFYSAKQAGYLAVFDVDDNGAVTALYPSDETTSAPVDAGSEVPIPDGAVVREGKGCEWVAAVFSDQALEMKAVATALEQAERDQGTCNLVVEIPGARSIRILPFKR